MRKNKSKSPLVPHLTLGKMIRLVLFIVLTAAGFVLSHNGHISTFGWGYAFGLIGMAILIG